MAKQKRQKQQKTGQGKRTLQAQAGNASAEDTVKMLLQLQVSPLQKSDAKTRRRVASALQSAQLIPDARVLPVPTKTEDGSPHVVLFRGGSWGAAAWVSERLQAMTPQRDDDGKWCKPAVLDFASDSNPGGGWRGNQQGTQEEELCRTSSLGLALEQAALQCANNSYSIPTHGCIYVEDVVVVRYSSGIWRGHPLWCSVIAAALRNADGQTNLVQSKVRGVVAAASGHGAFVGGSWGCGAFGNDTAEVAEAWRISALRAPQDMAFLVLAVPSKEAFAVFHRTFPSALVVVED